MKNLEAKVVVLGTQGVGKTSLVVRYVGKLFSRHVSPTIGASFFTCNLSVKDHKVKLQLWDTAGQERFRAMAPMYYRNSNAALLVFDITSRDSFFAVKDWANELMKNVEHEMVLCVLGNKSDLKDQRAVRLDEAESYAASIGAFYFETSALHNEGIEDAFLHTSIALIDQSLREGSNCNMYDCDQNVSQISDNSAIQLNPASDSIAGNARFCC